MQLTYTQGDAERWAAFSGDYNPIHFDAAAAKSLGMAGLCVHGMRAMLDVKSALSLKINESALLSDCLLFNCRLRNPVLCEQSYQLTVSERRGATGVQVHGELGHIHNPEADVSSKLSEVDPQPLVTCSQSNVTHGVALDTHYNQFKAVEKHPVPLWSFYDALLFRLLVNAPETLETVQSIVGPGSAGSLKEMFSQVQVVQTHHQTRFSRQLLWPVEDEIGKASLNYAIQPTLVAGTPETGLALVAGIQAWHISEMPISVAITLKTGPLAL